MLDINILFKWDFCHQELRSITILGGVLVQNLPFRISNETFMFLK